MGRLHTPIRTPADADAPSVATPSTARPDGAEPPPVELEPEAQGMLLALARSALASAASEAGWASSSGSGRERSGRESGPGSSIGDDPRLAQPAAVFVTLTREGELRGCMGRLVADLPVAEAVISSATSAALFDPRFAPVSADELPALRLDVSVLGPAVPLTDPAAFRPGVEGIVVERDGRGALLLPEVATEFGWGATEMLEAVCRKAGLARDAWRDPWTRLLVFRTLRFGGPAVEGDEGDENAS